MNSLEWVLVIIGFTGWTVTLIAAMKYTLPNANALSVLHKLSNYVDERIATMLERTERLRGKLPAEPPKRTQQPTPQQNSAHEAMRSVFGGTDILTPIDDQPDADDLEVVS